MFVVYNVLFQLHNVYILWKSFKKNKNKKELIVPGPGQDRVGVFWMQHKKVAQLQVPSLSLLKVLFGKVNQGH